MERSRETKIEIFAGDGELDNLKKLLGSNYSQREIDMAICNAVAYSQVATAEYLLSLGATFSGYDFEGVYYAVHNNELEGLKFAISKGVDINVNNGMLINTCVFTSTNTKQIEMMQWLLDNGADPIYLTEQSHQVINDSGTDELKNLMRIALNDESLFRKRQ